MNIQHRMFTRDFFVAAFSGSSVAVCVVSCYYQFTIERFLISFYVPFCVFVVSDIFASNCLKLQSEGLELDAKRTSFMGAIIVLLIVYVRCQP